MYCHIKDYEIRYTDVDVKDDLKLSSLLSVMQESACLSADELHFGYGDIAPKNVGFILVNWYLELFRPVRLGEKITVHTWPLKPKKLIIFRDFELYVGSEKVGVATTRWCMIDVANFRTLPSSVIFENDYREYNDFRSVDFNNWKIPAVTSSDVCYEKSVSYSDYDHYNHVNNTKYADFVLDAFPVEQLVNKHVAVAQMSYVKQCKYGEKLVFTKEFSDGFWVVEGKVDGEVRVQFKVKFDED